jgi:hypothetical protein
MRSGPWGQATERSVHGAPTPKHKSCQICLQVPGVTVGGWCTSCLVYQTPFLPPPFLEAR